MVACGLRSTAGRRQTLPDPDQCMFTIFIDRTVVRLGRARLMFDKIARRLQGMFIWSQLPEFYAGSFWHECDLCVCRSHHLCSSVQLCSALRATFCHQCQLRRRLRCVSSGISLASVGLASDLLAPFPQLLVLGASPA